MSAMYSNFESFLIFSFLFVCLIMFFKISVMVDINAERGLPYLMRHEQTSFIFNLIIKKIFLLEMVIVTEF